MVPLVDGEVVVAGDGDDGGHRHGRVSVGGHMCYRRVGKELHYHADVVLNRREHHRRLNTTTHTHQCTVTALSISSASPGKSKHAY